MHLPDLTAWSPETWSAAGTLATAVVAIAAAFVAWRQVKEARALRSEQAQPYVFVDFQPSRAWNKAVNLVVENIGKTAAYDVKIELDQRMQATKEHPGYALADSVLLTDGVPTMPPGRRIEAFFDVSYEHRDSGLPLRYVATVTCKDSKGKTIGPDRFVLDLAPTLGLTEITEYGLHDGMEALRDINKLFSKWDGQRGGLKVTVRDGDARDERDREYAERVMEEQGRARQRQQDDEQDVQP